MATRAYKEKTLTLANGKELELLPLSIKNLRKFMDIWGAHIEYLRSIADKPEGDQPSERELTARQFDVYVELATLGLIKSLKEDEEFEAENEKALMKKIKDFVEDEVDEESIYVILQFTGGLRVKPEEVDPNSLTGVPNL